MESQITETSRMVHLPIEIPYDVIAGGACRDCICGTEPSDYDIFFSDKSKYIEALRIITERPKMKCVKTRVGVWFDIKNSLLRCEEKINNKTIKYDLILCDTDLDGIIEHIISSFDFTVNCCFQEEGSMINCLKSSLSLYKSKTLEININEISLKRLLKRIKKFQKRGWVAGSSTVKFCFDRIAKMIESPNDFAEQEKGFIEKSGGYEPIHYIHEYSVWKNFFPVVPDEHLILGFLSDCDVILEATRCEYEKRKKKAEKTAKGGFIQRICDLLINLEDPCTKEDPCGK